MTEFSVVETLKRFPYGLPVEILTQIVYGYVDAYSLKRVEQSLHNDPRVVCDNGNWMVKGACVR